MIPKKIFQTHQTNTPPFYLYPFVWTWKTLKGFEYQLYSDQDSLDFVEHHYPAFLPYFLKLRGVEQADVFRLMVVYEYGGIYTDLDTSVNCDLEKFLTHHDKYNVILGVEIDTDLATKERLNLHSTFAVCNWTFMANKKHLLIKKMLGDVMTNVIEGKEQAVIFKTGPGSITKTYLTHKNTFDDVILLPIADFGAGQKHSNSPDLSEGKILHHFVHSWWRDRSFLNKAAYGLRALCKVMRRSRD